MGSFLRQSQISDRNKNISEQAVAPEIGSIAPNFHFPYENPVLVPVALSSYQDLAPRARDTDFGFFSPILTYFV